MPDRTINLRGDATPTRIMAPGCIVVILPRPGGCTVEVVTNTAPRVELNDEPEGTHRVRVSAEER